MPEIVLKLGDTVLQTVVFDKDIMSIGRSRDNDVVVENLSVSRNHARIRRQGGKYILTDLNSANGTYVNGVRVSKTEIVDDDVISIGKHKMQFVNKVMSDEEIIVDAFGADRTMLVDRAPTAQLCITEGKLKGKEFTITKFETSVGKASNNDVVIGDDWFLSKKQAVIVRKASDYEIQDLGGFRKTKVNGTALTEPRVLKSGDIIEFGSTRCMFQFSGEFAQTPTGRVPQEMALEDSIFSSGISYAQTEQAVSLEPEEGEESDAALPLAEEILVAASDAHAEVKRDREGVSTKPDDEVEAAAEPASVDLSSSTEESVSIEGLTEEMPKAPEPVAAEKPQLSGRKKRRGRDREKSFESSQRFSNNPLGQESLAAPESADEGGAEEIAAVAIQNPPGEPAVASSIDEVALWENALNNKSPIIRKQAAKMLKKLTGKDYAI